jgi:hypothetical protein
MIFFSFACWCFYKILAPDIEKILGALLEAIVYTIILLQSLIKASVKLVMRMLICVMLFKSIACAQTIQVKAKFVKAINLVETGGKSGMIIGKHNEIGSLQIRRQCWKESGVKGRFEDCAKRDYSIAVMNAYFRKHARKALETNNYEVLARRWNGGPEGDKKQATLNYWKRVKAVMDNL